MRAYWVLQVPASWPLFKSRYSHVRRPNKCITSPQNVLSWTKMRPRNIELLAWSIFSVLLQYKIQLWSELFLYKKSPISTIKYATVQSWMRRDYDLDEWESPQIAWVDIWYYWILLNLLLCMLFFIIWNIQQLLKGFYYEKENMFWEWNRPRCS